MNEETNKVHLPWRADVTGMVFGDRKVLGLDKAMKDSGSMNYWKCQCLYCGEITHVAKYDLVTGKRIWCRHSSILDPHDDTPMAKSYRSRHPLYKLWESAVNNCYNPNSKYYDIYGGKGLLMCEEWYIPSDPDLSFRNFFKWAIENGYIYDKTSSGRNCCRMIRRDHNDGYNPDNCEFKFLRAYKKPEVLQLNAD